MEEPSTKNPASNALAQLRCRLELAMDSHGKDIDGTTRGIETGIRDVLVITGQPVHSAKVGTVKEIEGFFRAGRNGSVTNKAIYATDPEVFRVDI